MSYLIDYYNKFNEEKRFDSRHGQVEYRVTMHYIEKMLEKVRAQKEKEHIRIFDIGAGTGRYAVPLADAGYEVHALELVKHNLSRMKAKSDKVRARLGNALDLKKYPSDYFDLTLLFGPMYHLFTKEDKVKALSEAKRVTVPGGIIMVAYCMNEYGLISYAFRQGHLSECLEKGRIDENFHCISEEEDLYDYVRIEDINYINERTGIKRLTILSPDGPANYIRPALKEMSSEEFEFFVQYQIAVAERSDLIGAAAHTVDILLKE